jgi:putative ABC transport system permease protein
MPGVEHVSLSAGAPMTMSYSMKVFLPGRDSAITLNGAPASVAGADTSFFAATSIRLRSGRLVGSVEQASDSPVTVINSSGARALWGSEPPIGKCVVIDKATNPCYVVIGVVEDSHWYKLVENPSIQLFVPTRQLPVKSPAAAQVVVHSTAAVSASVVTNTRALLKETFPTARSQTVRRLGDALASQLQPWRLGSVLFTVFGVLALVVAAIGVYGTVAYSFALRQGEMAVRLALGAQASSLVRLMMLEGIRVLAYGVVIGLGLALALGRFVGSLVYGVSAHDPVAFAIAALLILIVGGIACIVPARRAASLDPARSLRLN